VSIYGIKEKSDSITESKRKKKKVEKVKFVCCVNLKKSCVYLKKNPCFMLSY